MVGQLAARVVKFAQQNNVTKVHTVGITAGQLRMFDQDFMQRYFNIFTRGTVAEGAELVITVLPISYQCNACGADYEMTPKEWLAMDVNKLACIHCASEDITLVTGGEYQISDIIADVEDEDELFGGSGEASEQEQAASGD